MPELRNLMIKRIAVVDSPANDEVFTIIKSIETEGNEKDQIYKQMLDSAVMKTNKMTKEQAMAEYLKTPEGKADYERYESASVVSV